MGLRIESLTSACSALMNLIFFPRLSLLGSVGDRLLAQTDLWFNGIFLTDVLKRMAQIISPCGERSASDIYRHIFMLLLDISSPSKTVTDLKMGLL